MATWAAGAEGVIGVEAATTGTVIAGVPGARLDVAAAAGAMATAAVGVVATAATGADGVGAMPAGDTVPAAIAPAVGAATYAAEAGTTEAAPAAPGNAPYVGATGAGSGVILAAATRTPDEAGTGVALGTV
jgi:hypothetical protein